MDLLLRRRMLIDRLSAASDPYLLQPFTITFDYVETVDTFSVLQGTGGSITGFYIKLNDGEWTFIDFDESPQVDLGFYEIDVHQGDVLQIKATGTWASSTSGNWYFTMNEQTTRLSLSGNIMSLIAGDNFTTTTVVPNYALRSLFYNSYATFGEIVTSIKNLRLPALTVGTYAYSNLFYNFTLITETPEIKATSLGDRSCSGMFNGCSSLITAPELPATDIGQYVYQTMFQNCTSLTSAPSILPAVTLAANCYRQMFQGCSKLTTTPILPAETLVTNCYYRMFYNCSKLNYIKAMFTTTPSTSYCNNWVNGVASSGTFVKNSAASWNVTGTSGIPSGWTVQTANS